MSTNAGHQDGITVFSTPAPTERQSGSRPMKHSNPADKLNGFGSSPRARRRVACSGDKMRSIKTCSQPEVISSPNKSFPARSILSTTMYWYA